MSSFLSAGHRILMGANSLTHHSPSGVTMELFPHLALKRRFRLGVPDKSSGDSRRHEIWRKPKLQ
jgi:hypothetical protein